MGDVERRIEALERAYGVDLGPNPERERLLSEIRNLAVAGGLRSARDPKRRMALDELEA